MGEAASGADLTVVTSDNPRTEDPAVIIEEVASGVSGGEQLMIEADRRLAIRGAVGEADAGDIVLVLGKGHEQGQDFGSRVEAFDDRVVAREEASALDAATGTR